jgi:hypothetical protein
LAQVKPNPGLSGAVAFKQMTDAGSKVNGHNWMFLKL